MWSLGGLENILFHESKSQEKLCLLGYFKQVSSDGGTVYTTTTPSSPSFDLSPYQTPFDRRAFQFNSSISEYFIPFRNDGDYVDSISKCSTTNVYTVII